MHDQRLEVKTGRKPERRGIGVNLLAPVTPTQEPSKGILSADFTGGGGFLQEKVALRTVSGANDKIARPVRRFARWSLFTFLVFVLATNVSFSTLPIPYLVLVSYSGPFALWVLLRRRSGFEKVWTRSLLAWIPLSMLFVWTYGVAVGFFRGNSVVGITRNFAGMVFYLVFYFLCYAGMSNRELARVTIVSAFAVIGTALLVTYQYWAGGGSLFGARTFYSANLSVLCVPLSVILLGWSSGGRLGWVEGRTALNRRWFSLFFFVIGSYVLVLATLSKGYILAYVALIFSIPSLSFIRALVRGRVNLRAVILITFCTLLSLGVVARSQEFRVQIRNLFTGELSGNEVRLEQAKELIADSTITGRGLGAALASGYSRDDLGYGFETTYFNLIHKFGLFSGVIFFGYLATVGAAIRGIVRNADPFPSAAALGAMVFLIPAAGNPILYAPVSTVLHCAALYWLIPSGRRLGLQLGRVPRRVLHVTGRSSGRP